ncbi:MAG: class I SAM-dependent methyltransferase [Bacillota bacterium]|nr:class I SAM-dependent methyltransferase [Bacillota bacterium]
MDSTISYDHLATFYDAFIDQAVYDSYLDLLNKYTARGTLLDIGCGTGNLSVELAAAGYAVTATDLAEEMLAIVRYRASERKVRIREYVYDMLDPIDERFDTVIASMDVINHLTDLEDVQFGFTNIFEALNENGVFLFDVLSAEYIDALDGYSEDDEEFHFHWECHRGGTPHSIVHTVTLHLPDGDKDLHIYEETHPLSEYLRIAEMVGFAELERVVMPERTIIVLQKNR